MEEINIKEFLQYLLKYKIAIMVMVFACVLGIVTYDVVIKKPAYTTSTTVLLVKDSGEETTSSKVTTNDGITQSDLVLNEKLVGTYRKIMTSRLITQQVIDTLKLDYTNKQVKNEIAVASEDNTAILRISVTDKDPKIAMDIANTTAEVFSKEINNLYNINNVKVIDKALLPENPSNDTFVRDVVLAVMVAVVGASALIFVFYYFDDTLRYTSNMEEEIGMPIIAKVYKDGNGIDLIVDKKPNALASESIRTLRTNLQFTSIDQEMKTLLVTSSLPSEGKSFISANLAISFAQAGKKTLLMDCDLRKGRQHKIFKLSSKNGLSNLLISDIKDYPKYISSSKIDNLDIIPRGVFPPNPSELLNSKKNAALLELLKKQYDIIILDGAPCISNSLSDSLILSSMVDKTILVSSVNYTPKAELQNARKALENVGANIAGCVANNINVKKDSYGDYYYYHYGYGYGEKKTTK